MLNTRHAAYSAAITAALVGGCDTDAHKSGAQEGAAAAADNSEGIPSLTQSALPDLDNAAKYSIEDARSSPPADHPFHLLLQRELAGRGLQTPQELTNKQARALLDFCKTKGGEWTAHLYRATESIYPLEADFAQLRDLCRELNKENPQLWGDQQWISKFLKSTFNGSVTLEPVVVNDHVEIHFSYLVRPWEHPAHADDYTLIFEMTANIESPVGKPPHPGFAKPRYREEFEVTPNLHKIWSMRPILDAPLPAKGESLNVSLSMSYESYTSRTNYRGHDEPPLVKHMRFIRGGDVRNEKGEELLILEDGDARASVMAIASALRTSASWSDWHEKGAHSQETKRLEALWLGKKVPNITLQPMSGLKTPWRPVAGENQFGDPALVEFFQMACLPCLQAMPELADLSERTPGLKIVAFCNPENAENITGLDRTPPLAVPTPLAWGQFDVHLFPTRLLIDSKGYVRWVGTGSDAMPGQALVQRLIEESK